MRFTFFFFFFFQPRQQPPRHTHAHTEREREREKEVFPEEDSMRISHLIHDSSNSRSSLLRAGLHCRARRQQSGISRREFTTQHHRSLTLLSLSRLAHTRTAIQRVYTHCNALSSPSLASQSVCCTLYTRVLSLVVLSRSRLLPSTSVAGF